MTLTNSPVITNSPSQDNNHPDDHNLPTYDMTPRFKPLSLKADPNQSWDYYLGIHDNPPPPMQTCPLEA